MRRCDDLLSGGQGNDHLFGRAGEDFLVGDVGQDLIVGGFGADQIRARDGEIDRIVVVGDDEIVADDIDVIINQTDRDGVGDDSDDERNLVSGAITDELNRRAVS